MADDAPVRILILCTGNSARSIIGEALVSARPGFEGHSAGSAPRGEPHPMALEVLRGHGHETGGFRSKSWDVYGEETSPRMDAIITVCDNAAGEACPYWPGHPVQAHWGLPDPAAVEGPGQRAAFEATYTALAARIAALAGLDFAARSAPDLARAIQAIHDEAAMPAFAGGA